MLNLDAAQLAALSEVVRTGSFERAATALSVTPSAVSQRIKTLEERLGLLLVQRGQPCTATASGLRLCRHAEEVALLEHALSADLGPDVSGQGPPTIRIAANADSLATWLPAALAEAANAPPGALFDITVDDQDHSAEWLRRGEVAAAITSRAAPIQGCDCLPLGALRYVATASPVFMAQHFPDGVTAEAVRLAPMLTFNRKDRLQANWLKHCFGKLPTAPTHYLPSSHSFVDAALLGLGWGMNPEILVRDHLAEGRLVALDPHRTLDTPLFWQSARAARTALAPLRRAIQASAKALLHGP